MTDSRERLDAVAQFIYEPVADDLARVLGNLGKLASSSGISEEMVSHVVVSGGKMVRPTVTLLAGSLRPGFEERLITMATAIELLHIASLIHDDTVDMAKTRRGKATVSSVWGQRRRGAARRLRVRRLRYVRLRHGQISASCAASPRPSWNWPRANWRSVSASTTGRRHRGLQPPHLR